MAPSVELFPTDTLIRWIERSDNESRVKLFQIIDSVAWHYYNNGVLPTVHYFPFASDQTVILLFIEGFMKSRSQAPKVLSQELRPILNLRPQGDPLPFLSPVVPGITSETAQSLATTIAKTASVTMARQSNPATARYGGPSTAEPMQNRPDDADNTLWGSSDDFGHSLNRYHEILCMNNKRGKTAGVPDCQDYPRTPAERQLLVGRLVDAMVNFDGIVEKPIVAKSRRQSMATDQHDDVGAFKDNYRVERVRNTSREEIEILAWKVLYYTKNAQDGKIDLPDRYGKQVEYTRYPNFMARYEKVLEALKFSKALVDDLMAWDLTRRLVAAPDKELLRKKINKMGNDKKTVQLKAGIKALKEAKDEVAEKPSAGSSSSDATVTSVEAQQAVNEQLNMEATMAADGDEGSDAMSISSEATTEDDHDER